MSENKQRLKTKQLENLIADVPIRSNFHMTKGFRVTVGKRWKVTTQCYNQYHMLYMRDGYGKYYINEKEYDLFPGRIIFMSNGIPHYTRQEVSKAPAITTSFFDKIDNNTGAFFREKEPFYIVTTEKVKGITGRLFDDLFAHFQLNDLQTHRNRCSLLIGQILHQIFDSYQEEEAKSVNTGDKSVEQIIRYIRENPSARNSMETLASRVNMTADYFARLFKKHTGKSLKSFQVEIRLNYAKNLLNHTNLRVSEIAYELGYSDPYIFSKQFKSKFGKSPQSFQ